MGHHRRAVRKRTRNNQRHRQRNNEKFRDDIRCRVQTTRKCKHACAKIVYENLRTCRGRRQLRRRRNSNGGSTASTEWKTERVSSVQATSATIDTTFNQTLQQMRSLMSFKSVDYSIRTSYSELEKHVDGDLRNMYVKFLNESVYGVATCEMDYPEWLIMRMDNVSWPSRARSWNW